MALCLPCMAYAAAFTGVGVIKKRFSASSCDSQRERLKSLLGNWVSITISDKTEVGILEFDPRADAFEIKLEKHGLWKVVDEKDWSSIRPIGRDFNPNRRLSQRQKNKVEDQNRSISTLSDLFDCNLWETVLDKSGRLFSIYGNKTRLNRELTEPLIEGKEASLGRILRPEGQSDYGESCHCSLESNRSAMPREEGALVIIEGGRNLPDQLAASRHLHRVVLLARNAADYEICAGCMMSEASLKATERPVININFPPAMGMISFFHR